ncbi:hypothetical protein [Hephaestia caeni]|uniref:hypothetical protein n=1 Tax=Hephaestia caeni TaxID=645617 RepID=UPI001B86E2DB|nr:hypothetical protein [Hephaestia caeni]
MRMLTREELKLVAGGNSSSEIVVIGDPGGGGGGWGGGWPGGGWPGGDGGWGSGGGSGGGDGGGSVDVDVDIDPEANEADIVVTASIAPNADLIADFSLNDLSVNSISLQITNNGSVYTGTVNIENGSFDQSYQVDFGGGITGSLSFSTNGSSYSASGSLVIPF